MLAPGAVNKKTEQNISVIREPRKLEVTVGNSDIDKFETGHKRKTKLQIYINRRGPSLPEESTESKITSHIKKRTRIQKGTEKLRIVNETTQAECLLRNQILHALWDFERQKFPTNFAPQITEQIEVSDSTSDQSLLTASPIRTSQKLQIATTSAPRESLQQILPRSGKRLR